MISEAFPLDPPVDWFTAVPDWFKPNMKLTVITEGPDAGRVAATVAQRGTYLLGAAGLFTSEDSPTQYRDAMQNDTVCADGTIIRTAALAANVNHVPVDPMWTYGRAVDAMANTGAQMCRVVFKDVPGYGTVALGAAWPGIDDLQLRKMQTSALSGDWRWREEYNNYDMAGAIFVNSPGLPLPNRPVFTPVAMAASLSSPHPAIVGSWQEARMFCASCGAPTVLIPNPQGGQSVMPCQTCVARTAAAPVPPTAPSPDGMNTPSDGPSLDERVAALEERMDGVESWLTEDAMSEVEGMGMAAAMPDTETAAKYNADQLRELADKDQVFNKDDLNYPIGDCEDVRNAVSAVGRGDANAANIKGYIIRVAKKINCVDSLPPDWVDNSTQVGGDVTETVGA